MRFCFSRRASPTFLQQLARRNRVCLNLQGRENHSRARTPTDVDLFDIAYAFAQCGWGSNVTVSGFRATALTLLNEMGRWNPNPIER
jgi:hypothetical protein